MACTRHRVFLAALICVAKYLNDSSPKNKHWQRYAFHFALPEVNLMEKQLLFLLDYNLDLQESELISALSVFMAPRTRQQPAPCAPVVSVLPTPVKVEQPICAQPQKSVPVSTGLPTPPVTPSSRSERLSTPGSVSQVTPSLLDAELHSPARTGSSSSRSSLYVTPNKRSSRSSLRVPNSVSPPSLQRRGSASSLSSEESTEDVLPNCSANEDLLWRARQTARGRNAVSSRVGQPKTSYRPSSISQQSYQTTSNLQVKSQISEQTHRSSMEPSPSASSRVPPKFLSASASQYDLSSVERAYIPHDLKSGRYYYQPPKPEAVSTPTAHKTSSRSRGSTSRPSGKSTLSLMPSMSFAGLRSLLTGHPSSGHAEDAPTRRIRTITDNGEEVLIVQQ